MKTKNEIRRVMRARRRSLTEGKREQAAKRLAARAAALAVFRESRHIAFYFAADGEIDPAPLMRRAWRMNKRCYLPVLPKARGGALAFAPVAPGTVLAPNRYGIPEPRPGRGRLRPAAGMDLILVPLVAFDARGNRLGMGAGYYDRTLAALGGGNRGRPFLLGLAYEFQRLRALRTEPWDVPLGAVATEAAYHRMRP